MVLEHCYGAFFTDEGEHLEVTKFCLDESKVTGQL